MLRPFHYFAVSLFSVLSACTGGQFDNIENRINYDNMIINSEPKYAGTEFVSLDTLFVIDLNLISEYYISRMTWLTADSDTNLYVLDAENSMVNVFDSQGRYLKSFGEKGTGKGQMRWPVDMFINAGKLHIYDHFDNLNVWSLNGEYLREIPIDIKGDNMLVFHPYKDFLIGAYYLVLNMDSSNRIWVVDKYSRDIEKVNSILVFNQKDAGSLPLWRFRKMLPVDSRGNVFFPVDYDKYIVNKYAHYDSLMLSFGREFPRQPYSQSIVEHYNNRYAARLERGVMPDIPEYPPCIRRIFVDSRDYVWVVVGEWYIDALGSEVTSTIDIYDNNGIFLYSFKSPAFHQTSAFYHDRLYTYSNANNEIIAFELTYYDDRKENY